MDGGNLMGKEEKGLWGTEKVFWEAGACLPSFLWWKEIDEKLTSIFQRMERRYSHHSFPPRPLTVFRMDNPN